MNPDDRQLLVRTRQGDEAAARDLWARFAPRLLAYARAVLGATHRDAAEDIIQTVFVSVVGMPVRRLKRIDDVPAWLLSLTRNASLNHLRSIRRERTRRQQGADAPQSPPPMPVRDDFAAAFDALPRRYRESLFLKHIAGLTFDQLALALGINRNTAASRHRAAVAVLRRSLNLNERTYDDEQPMGERHA